MKKTILSLAVAACCVPVVAMADANIYGQFRYSINSVDADDGNGSTLKGDDNVSLFGLKVSSESNGITAFAHLQAGANADGDGGSTTTRTPTFTTRTVKVLKDGVLVGTGTVRDTDTDTDTTDGGRAFAQRFYFGGLKGDFGTVAYGRMSTSYKMVGFKMDPFYNLSHVGANGAVSKSLATYGLSAANNGFTDNAIQYTSPSIDGLKVNVGIYVDDAAGNDHGTGLGVAYAAKDFNVGVQFVSAGKTATVANLTADGDAVRIHGGYKADAWSVDASYEKIDVDKPGNEKGYTFLVGKYNVSKETQLAMTIGNVKDNVNRAGEGTGFTLGAFQTIAPKTQVYASYSSASIDNTGGVNTGADPSVFSLGAIHKF